MSLLQFSSRSAPPLWLLALLSLAAYITLAVWMPLWPPAGPPVLADIRTFVGWPDGTVAYAALLCLLFGLLALAYRSAQRRPPTLSGIVLPALLFCLALVAMYPVNATDLFRYLIRGRITAVHGENPYLSPPVATEVEPYRALAGEWSEETSPYGPVWELTAAAAAYVSGDDPALGLWLLKGATILAFLLGAAVIWSLLAGAGKPVQAGRTLLWAWNPALLLTFAANGHNDSLMLLWLLLGILLIQRRHPALGLIVMALAPLSKLTGLLPIPFFFLATLRALPTLGARMRLVTLAGAGSLFLAWLTFLPFGSPVHLGLRLVHEAGGTGGFSPLATLALVSHRLGHDLKTAILAPTAMLLFALIYVWLLWQAWRGRPATRGAADSTTAYLLLAMKFRIWYASWIFPWLLLDVPEPGRSDRVAGVREPLQDDAERGDRRRTRPAGGDTDRDQNRTARTAEFRLQAGLWFLLTTQLSVLIYGQLRVFLLGRDQLWAHLIGVSFTFGLPLLLAAWQSGRRYQR